jgi:hypothetical protein
VVNDESDAKAPSLKWKSKLLSSSLPIEFEVARFLVTTDRCHVSADYPYLRREGQAEKEFSVDVHALFSAGDVDRFDSLSAFDLLVECKHRHPGTTWLFLPDPNRDFGMGTNGSALRGIDTFSPWFINHQQTRFAADTRSCYKAVEIDANTGNVHDSEFRHGVAQLHYALPALAASRIRSIETEHPDDNLPFFFAAVLVTNAPLIIASRRFSRSAIANASDVRELGRPVRYVSLHIEPGPEFERHVASQFAELPKLMKKQNFRLVEEARQRSGVHPSHLPSNAARILASGTGWIGLSDVFNRVIVCNLRAFPSLVKSLIAEVDVMATSLSRNLRGGAA